MKGCLINTRIGITHGVDVVVMVPSSVCTKRYIGTCTMHPRLSVPSS